MPEDFGELTATDLYLLALNHTQEAEARIEKAYEWGRSRAETTAKGVFAAASLIAAALVTFVFKIPLEPAKGAGNPWVLAILAGAIVIFLVAVGIFLWSRLRPVSRLYITALGFYSAWKRAIP